MKPLATTDEKQIDYINSGKLGLMYPQGEHEGRINLYAIPDTHRVVSVELLKAYQSAIEAGQFMGFDEEYEQMQAIIDNKGEKE